MAFCTNCGQKLVDGDKFCSHCGKSVETLQNGTNNQRKTIYDGNLHKCPNCGELLDSFMINCPSCGYEIRNLHTQSPVIELAKKIEKAKSVDEKIELITNFYVPNTREDIYDFFILAVSNLEDTVYDTDDAWQAKLEQTYHKAKISFGNTPEFDYIEKQYHKTLGKVSKRGFLNFVRKNKMVCITGTLVGIGLLFLIVGVITLMTNSDNEAGWLLVLFSMMFMLSPIMVSVFFEDEKKKSRKQQVLNRVASNMQSVGKNATDFYLHNYDDVVEQLKILGFKNIEIKPEKKGILDIEGGVKSISIAGDSEFRYDDVFDVNAKIIIRYYSRKY